jgi:hypothetical protein
MYYYTNQYNNNIIGEAFNPIMDQESVRNFSRHMPSIAVNLPSKHAFGSDYIFAIVNSTEYNIENTEKFLKLIPGTHAWTIFSKYASLVRLPSHKVYYYIK